MHRPLSYLACPTAISIAAVMACCEIAAAQSPSNGEEYPDAEISLAVDDQLWLAKAVNANNIDVSTEQGVVLLEGTVKNAIAKRTAVRIAKMTEGVRAVVDQLEVSQATVPDQKVSVNVVEALAEDPATDTWDITVEVSSGAVTLSGSVDSHAESELAEDVAYSVKGVRKVHNEIEVQTEEVRSDAEIRQEIVQRFRWHARLDDDLITVDVEGGQVRLGGLTTTAYEKSLAESLCRIAGVRGVDARQLVVDWKQSGDTAERERPDDESIREAVMASFIYDPRVFSANPEVRVDEGIVTLSGYVEDLKAKRAAAQDAMNTRGVLSVRNYLKVRPKSQYADPELETHVENALLRDALVNRFGITVGVEAGEVYLYGNVDSHFEKLQAEDVATRVKGVTRVYNYLTVR